VFFLIPPYDWDRPERRVHRTRPAQAREKKGGAGAEDSQDQPYTTGAAAPQDPPDATAPVPRTTVYFIPGCYLGNIPPKDAKLPATCDQSSTQTFEP
jgi:hypothetical protein